MSQVLNGYILVTGGMGFIGSHTVIELLNSGYNVIIADNLSNSSIQVLEDVKSIAKIPVSSLQLVFKNLDITSRDQLSTLFSQYPNITAVLHFAGLKSVAESIRHPIKYYETNIAGTINLLQVMQQFKCYNLIFSSSATIYGTSDSPVQECDRIGIGITNPYGETKFVVERMLQQLAKTENNWHIISLRYFNPIGAHPSGIIGEDPTGIPENLMPYLLRVALGKKGYDVLKIYGSDYPTVDGTAVRDYIHVLDLAQGHVLALQKLQTISHNSQGSGIFLTYNLGTGKGTSVLQLVNSFIKTNGVSVPYVMTDRRPGDVPMLFASAKKAQDELGWKARLSIEDMCRDAWNFILNIDHDPLDDV